ncbi:hypothetical protein A2U01_0024021 [Trifolium medium]|uniref:Uncharacterized protein n=1 Tax=Trifolium medium TaxID=97028 RepID=A0A392NT20_9FABA|nr:hypothetical protein [Trifolium medium]
MHGAFPGLAAGQSVLPGLTAVHQLLQSSNNFIHARSGLGFF